MTTVKSFMSMYLQAADWQERPRLYVDRRINSLADHRAYDMAVNDYFSHVDLNGIWPNRKLRDAGYTLPTWYPDDSNQIESIACGFQEPVDALDALATSPDHAEHLRGLNIWKHHAYFGVSYCDVGGTPIYVVITAPPERSHIRPNTIHLPIIQRGIEHYELAQLRAA